MVCLESSISEVKDRGEMKEETCAGGLRFFLLVVPQLLVCVLLSGWSPHCTNLCGRLIELEVTALGPKPRNSEESVRLDEGIVQEGW